MRISIANSYKLGKKMINQSLIIFGQRYQGAARCIYRRQKKPLFHTSATIHHVEYLRISGLYLMRIDRRQTENVSCAEAVLNSVNGTYAATGNYKFNFKKLVYVNGNRVRQAFSRRRNKIVRYILLLAHQVHVITAFFIILAQYRKKSNI
jgi:hypothetical protein